MTSELKYQRTVSFLKAQLSKLIFITSILLLSPILSSCGVFSSPSPSAYPTSFIKGELNSKFNKDIEKSWVAVQKVAEESLFQIKSSRSDAFSAVLKCEDAQQRKIEITLEKEEPTITRIKIRVGLLGDAELSDKIFAQIREKVSK